MATENQAAEQEAPKQKISVKAILEDLANGMTREEIRQKLGVKKAQFARIMKHEKLLGKKTKLSASKEFDIEDDAPDEPVLHYEKGIKKAKAAKSAGGENLVAVPQTPVESAQTNAGESDSSGKW